MKITNCRNCHKIFNYISGDRICPACREEAERQFQNVKDYLRQNPEATIITVAEETNTDVRQIKQWIREERLEVTKGLSTEVVCETCGKPIVSGRYCVECKNSMASQLNNSIAKQVGAREAALAAKQESTSNKMRFINRTLK